MEIFPGWPDAVDFTSKTWASDAAGFSAGLIWHNGSPQEAL